MSTLRNAAQEYLSIRRAVGFKLARAEGLLLSFVDFADAQGSAHVTSELALRWATLPATASPAWWNSRLCVVRCFARHLSALDPSTQVPPLDLLPRVPSGTRRATPYLYSDVEIAALMDAASSRRFPLTAATCRTIIGLLAVTGMRVGEVLRLQDADVDWERGVLIVRQSKFDRSREVPLHPSTLDALRAYADVRNEHFPQPRPSNSFFVSWSVGQLSYGAFRGHFNDLVRHAGLKPTSPRCRPRLHDFRHRFACLTLEDWYRTGVDVQPRLPLLSTYLGHVDPISTYWYVSARPELLASATDRLNRFLGDLP
jgi:integrase/recombinase XerD